MLPTKATLNPVIKLVRQTMNEYGESPDKPRHFQDFYAKFQELHDRIPDQFPATDIVDNSAGNVLAGSDTTANSLRAIVMELARNPTYQRRLQDEIDELDKADKLPPTVTVDESEGMPFFQACVKEAFPCHWNDSCLPREQSWWAKGSREAL
ncbi:hypothetical protein NW760_015243 [Fusarium oxysporum]|nr:hypothetical protein NW769_015057 [Fusarium oxysporum]KAJ4212903.1 hypothetical protein NW760_015243 [Fusarium oxysporum]